MFRLKSIKYLILFNSLNVLLGQSPTNQNYNDSLEIKLEELKKKIHQFDETIHDIEDDLSKINNKINKNLSSSNSRYEELSNTISSFSDSLLTTVNNISIFKMNQQGSFERTFLEARLKLGKNQNFEWNGKQYSTNYPDESRASPTVLKIEELIVILEEKEKEFDKAIIQANSKVETLNNLIDEVKIDSNKQIKTLDKTITDRTLYWIIAILIIVIMVIVTFFFLKSKVAEQKDSLSSVKGTQEKLENESIQLDTKLIQILEQKLETAHQHGQPTLEVDHSLPLTLGNEIHRMRKRLKTMENSHATKILINRIDKLEEKINDMGYEIVDLEGEIFNEGMNVKVVNRIDSSELKTNEQVISRVIKPHIKFNDEIKQHAEVEVHQGI